MTGSDAERCEAVQRLWTKLKISFPKKNATSVSRPTPRSTMVNDFLMTMSSEDEAPRPVASTSKAKALTKKMLTRKEQLAAKKGLKASKKGLQKRKRVEESEEEEEEQMVIASDDDQAAMAEDFHFDGLGGGFVGEKRMQVWVRHHVSS